MPTLPQYVAQRRAQGVVRGPVPGAVDVGGLVQGTTSGLLSIADDQIREQRRIEHQQQVERERLAQDEARVHVINAESRMQMRVAEAMAEAESQPDGMVGITAKMLQNFDVWSKEDLDAAPETAKMMLATAQARMRGDINARIYGLEMRSRQKKVLTDFDAGADEDAKLAFADPSQAAAAIARRRALGGALALPEDLKAKQVNNAVEKIAYSAAMSLADRDPDGFLQIAGVAGGKTGKDGKPLPSDPAKAAEAVKSNPILSAMSPEALQRVTERATMLSVTRKAQADAERERQERRAEVAANKAFREATAAYTVMEGMISAGRSIDMTNPANLDNIRKIQAVPEYAQAFKARMESLPKNVAVSMQPLAQQQATLNALYQQRNTKGSSPGLEKEIQRVEGVLDASRKGYAKDPLQYVVDVGVVPKMAPMDMTSIDTVMRDLPARVEQASVASRSGGASAAPFTAAEAPDVERMFASWSPQQQADAIGKMAGTVPPEQMTALSKMIDPKNRALTLAMQAGGARTSQNRFTAELILTGAQKFADTKTGQASSKGDAVRQQLREDISKYIDGDQPGMATLSGDAREAAIDAAIYINAGLETLGSKASAERAATLALNGKVETHAGKRIPLPPGQTYDQFRSVLSNYPASDLSSQSKDGAFYGASKMTLDEFRRELPTMPLQPAGDGIYYVRSGAGLVKGANGRPIVIRGQ